jgi:hypothetical protein
VADTPRSGHRKYAVGAIGAKGAVLYLYPGIGIALAVVTGEEIGELQIWCPFRPQIPGQHPGRNLAEGGIR